MLRRNPPARKRCPANGRFGRRDALLANSVRRIDQWIIVNAFSWNGDSVKDIYQEKKRESWRPTQEKMQLCHCCRDKHVPCLRVPKRACPR
jgi:hypothetical protein